MVPMRWAVESDSDKTEAVNLLSDSMALLHLKV